MSSGKTHRTVGVAIGVGAVFAHNYIATSEHHFMDYLGAAIGGYIGAKIPDIIDPPTSPNHRSIGHSAVLNTLLIKWVLSNIGTFRTYCFKQANEKQNGDGSINFTSECYRFLAGVSLGIIAGHVSHLALDATTPKSLPLIA